MKVNHMSFFIQYRKTTATITQYPGLQHWYFTLKNTGNGEWRARDSCICAWDSLNVTCLQAVVCISECSKPANPVALLEKLVEDLEFVTRPRRALLETPETFGAYFSCLNFPRLLKTKIFPGMKFFSKLPLSCLEIIVKDQLYRIRGSQF